MYPSSREKSITIEYQDVVPSTDLPPYMKGKMHCYLHVVVGKLAWKRYDCNDYKLPLPSSTYIRLRWWGDTSQGTYFRPQIEKYSRIIKCRSQFCVRSKPQQIAAYFKDMGSATFDILQSPNSIPIARALVPAVVSLSFNCSVRGSFPVRTPSARTIGELQVAMSFKPRRCDCDEINLEALGTCKTVSYRACPPRLECFVRKQKELREGRVPVHHAPNSKGSSCYTKLSASGRYGTRSCICEKEKACVDRIADCNDGASSSDDTGKCYAAAAQNNCQFYEAPQECMFGEDPSDSCQARVLNGLIEQTKQLNKNLVTALNCQNEEKCFFKPVECCRGYARVSIHALQLHKPLEQLMNFPNPCCPLASNAPQDMRQMYIVQYTFPSQLVWSCYDSTMNQVKSVNTWPGGCVRFDQNSVIEIMLSPDTLNNWMSEILKFTILRKDVNCSEATIIGVAELPLRCIVEDPEFSFSGCIPVTTCGARRFQCVQTQGTLEVSIKLSHGNKPFPMCAFALEPPSRPFPCTVVTSYDEGRKDKGCKYKCVRKEKKTSNFHNMIAKPCGMKTKTNQITKNQFFTPTCLFLYLFLDRAENIPAARFEVDECCKCFPPNIYLVCRNFSVDNDDVSITATVWNNHNPAFQYAELIPIKVNDQFLEILQYKSVVVEVWTKMPDSCPGSDKLMGLVRLPLTYFYDVLKDHDVTKFLSKKDSPLVPVNDFLPIVDVFSNEERGQLKLVFALGTSDQINSFRKSVENSETDETDRSEPKASEYMTSSDESNSIEHTLRVTVHGMQGFMPCASQICGRTNCYIKYSFPSQKCCDNAKDNRATPDATLMKHFQTRTKPCARNPQWEFKTIHKYVLPAGVPLQNLFSNFNSCSGKELSFQLWTSQYCARQSDKLIAKGSLLVEKLCSLLSCKRRKCAKETYQIPLTFVNPCNKMAGDLFISLKHSTKPSEGIGNVPTTRCCQDVQIRFALVRASGLRAGVKMATGSDVEGGVTTYATIKTSFLPQPQSYITRSVPSSYSPDYNHCVEVHCPVMDCSDVSTPLIGLLDAGFIDVQIWQGFSSDSSLQKEKEQTDVLLGESKVPTRLLLFKTKGFNSWCSLLSKCDKSKAAGAIQVSLTFSSENALDSILEGARESNWCPDPGSHLEALFDLRCGLKLIEKFNTNEEYATFRVSITNLWIPKKWLGLSNEAHEMKLNKNSCISLRYKFHDFDTYASSPFPAYGKSKKKEETLLNLKLAHQKAFLCKPTPCLFWYLKEEIFEIQVWHSKNRFRKTKKRSNGSDTLLGSLFIDLSPLLDGRMQTAQHIFSIFPLFKAEKDDLGDSSAQVCLHLIPGNDVKAYETDDSDQGESSLLQHDLFRHDRDDNDDDDDDDYFGKDYGRETDDENAHKSDKGNCFSAIVSVERAMHLAPHHSAANKDRNNVGVNFYVSYPVDCDGKEEKTKMAVAAPSPVWNDAREIQLDRKLLKKNGGKILFQICQNGECAQKAAEAHKRVVGFATVDISALANGFRAVTGWYNVVDQFGKCQGEIKIGITPTDPSKLARCTGGSWLPCHKMIHAMPLLCPVVGPMGTVYIPGISGFADSVVSTFLKENELSKQNERSKSCKEALNYTFDTLFDSHKNTLQQNMAELDVIRGNLQQQIKRPGRMVTDFNTSTSAGSLQFLPSSSPFQTLFSGLHQHIGVDSLSPASAIDSSTYPPGTDFPQQTELTDANYVSASDPGLSQSPNTSPSTKPVLLSDAPRPSIDAESLSSVSSDSQTVASPTPSGQPVEASAQSTKNATPTSELNNTATPMSELADNFAPNFDTLTEEVTNASEPIRNLLPVSDKAEEAAPASQPIETSLITSQVDGDDTIASQLSSEFLSASERNKFLSTSEPNKYAKSTARSFKSATPSSPSSPPSTSTMPTFFPNKAAPTPQQLKYFSPTAQPLQSKTPFARPVKPSTPASGSSSSNTKSASRPIKFTQSRSKISKTPALKTSSPTLGSKTRTEACGTAKTSKLLSKTSSPTFSSKTRRETSQTAKTSQPSLKTSKPTFGSKTRTGTSGAAKTSKLSYKTSSPTFGSKIQTGTSQTAKTSKSSSKLSSHTFAWKTRTGSSRTAKTSKSSSSKLSLLTYGSKTRTGTSRTTKTSKLSSKISSPTFGSKTRTETFGTAKTSQSSSFNFKPASQSSLSSRPTYKKIQADRLASQSTTSSFFKPIAATAPTFSTTKTNSSPILQPSSTSFTSDLQATATPSGPISIPEVSQYSLSKSRSDVPTIVDNQLITTEIPGHVTSSLSTVESASKSQTPSEAHNETSSTTTSESKNTLIPSGWSDFKKFCVEKPSFTEIEFTSHHAIVKRKVIQNNDYYFTKRQQDILPYCTLSVNRTKIHTANIRSVCDFTSPELEGTNATTYGRAESYANV